MILTGVPSGDLECWCFLVDYRTFQRIKGTNPCRWDLGRFRVPGSQYKYMLYPSDLIKADEHKETTICIEYDIKVPVIHTSSER